MLKSKSGRIIAVALLALTTALGTVGGDYARRIACAEPPDETEVLEAAERDLPNLLEVISHMGYQKYGFKDESELEAVQFGEPVGEETLIPLTAYGGALPGVENLKRYAPAELIPQVTAAVGQPIEAQGGE